jgi:hypothetical protein
VRDPPAFVLRDVRNAVTNTLLPQVHVKDLALAGQFLDAATWINAGAGGMTRIDATEFVCAPGCWFGRGIGRYTVRFHVDGYRDFGATYDVRYAHEHFDRCDSPYVETHELHLRLTPN